MSNISQKSSHARKKPPPAPVGEIRGAAVLVLLHQLQDRKTYPAKEEEEKQTDNEGFTSTSTTYS